MYPCELEGRESVTLISRRNQKTMPAPKYGESHPKSDIHILDANGEAYCGAFVEETFYSSSHVQDHRKAVWHTCTKCLSAKHATDAGKGQLDVATAGDGT